MLRPGDTLGPYHLVDVLGRGGFGVVWLAEKRTPVVTMKVALKVPIGGVLDLDELRQEAGVWATITGHPNILPIVDADVYDGFVAIVSEYAPSGTLAGWLTHNGGSAPSLTSALEMIDGVLAGVEHLHGLKIVHRDLKPGNVLLQGQTPRLGDFGLARLLTTQQTLHISGTIAYMPPEAFHGVRDEQTDLWAAAVVFYELLSGALPFSHSDNLALQRSIVEDEPRPLPSFPPAFQQPLQRFFACAFEKQPSRRFGSASEMRAALQEIRRSVAPLGSSDIRPVPDNALGHGVRIGGRIHDEPLHVVAGNWINYYDSGWVRSGWLYTAARSFHFAETFFKIHLFHEGHGYIHVLAAANPGHTVWLETSVGSRREERFAWSDDPTAQQTALWFFRWK